MKVTILGCGSSHGVPVIGCNCHVCTSENPRNKRLRASLLLQINDINLVIDTSPDFRQQMLRKNINKIDAVLYTHDHADHTHGLDDIRPYNFMQREAIHIYGDADTINSLQNRFSYAFLPKPKGNAVFRPSLTPILLPDTPVYEFTVSNIQVISFIQRHGKSSTLGYRIGNFAYSTDVDILPEPAFDALEGIEYWVVDCLRYTPSYSHSHLEQTLQWIKRVNPRQAVLTHMAHEFDYDTLSAELPAGVVAGYDGMVLEI